MRRAVSRRQNKGAERWGGPKIGLRWRVWRPAPQTGVLRERVVSWQRDKWIAGGKIASENPSPPTGSHR